MIAVLCANPALDVTYRVDRLVRGEVHRVAAMDRRAGGKGANVARVLHQLGASVLLVVPLGGAAGDEYGDELAAAGVPLLRVPVSSPPRGSVCVSDGDATVFNEPGTALTEPEWSRLVDAVLGTDAELLVLSGSLPPGAPFDGYAQLVRDTRAGTVIDTSGAPLAAVFAARPDVVAPNLAEARAVVGDDADAHTAARRLCAAGARAAVVSAGPDGLVAVTSTGAWSARPPAELEGNPTGAGDALTAALALGLVRGDTWPDIARSALATSAAALPRQSAGEIELPLRESLLADVAVEEVLDAARHHG